MALDVATKSPGGDRPAEAGRLNALNMERLPPRAKLLVIPIASFVLASLACLLSLELKLAPTYPEFIVGYLAWHAQAKLQDLIAVPVFVAVFVGSFWWAAHRLGYPNPLAGATAAASPLATQVLWWSLPAVAALAGLMIGSFIDVKLIFISAAGLACVLVVSAHGTLTQSEVRYATLGMALFAALLLSAIPIEMALILGRAPARLAGDIDLFRYIQATYILITISFAVVTSLALWTPERLFRRLPELLLIGQIGLPSFFLTLYPARLATPDGSIIKYATTFGFKVVIVAAVLVGMVDVVRRYRQYQGSDEHALERLLSPIALFALLIAWRVGNTAPPHISPDDYHFGEFLIGWWSYLQGMVPYVGYIPAHGIIEDDFAGILSFLFYDGTAGSILEVRRLSIAILGFAAFAALLRFSHSLGLALISVAFISWSPMWLFLTPFLCLWFCPSLRRKPARWLSVWLLTAPVVVLGVPAQGLMLVTASAIMAINAVWQLWRNRHRQGLTGLAFSLAVIVAAVFVTPAEPMLFGAVGYVLENGPVNQLAYGIPWDLSWSARWPQSGLVFEAIRMSWIAVPIACLAIIVMSVKTPQRRDPLLPAIVILLFVFLLTPYAMGRIDPGAISRAGRLASFGWAVLLPVVAWHVIRPKHKTAMIVVIAGMSAALNFTPVSLSQFMSSAAARIATGPLRDARSAGLANIGPAMVEDVHWERLIRLNTLINSKLAPEEPYLDLTSRNAHYFYLNRKPPIAVTAPYNMVPLPQQQRAAEKLARDLPRLALLEADNVVHDGRGLALRTPVLYQFVIDHYIPRWEKGFILGYRKQDDARQPSGDATLEVDIKKVTDDNWEMGVNRHDAALILDDAVLVGVLREGMQVQFPQGQRRTIFRVWPEGQAIWLDGDVLHRDDTAALDSVKVTISGPAEHAYRLALFEKAFSASDLHKIPVAWGRSETSLRRRMELITAFGPLTPTVHDVSVDNGLYRVTGSDPHLTFDLSPFAISGRKAGLLRLEFACLDQTAEPRIQLFWWGDVQAEPDERTSLRFTADDGVLLVPLDAFPRWLTLNHVRSLRLDLDDATACGAIIVKDLAFHQRTAYRAE